VWAPDETDHHSYGLKTNVYFQDRTIFTSTQKSNQHLLIFI